MCEYTLSVIRSANFVEALPEGNALGCWASAACAASASCPASTASTASTASSAS